MYEVGVIEEKEGIIYNEISFMFNEKEKAIEFADQILSISKYKIEIKYYPEVYDE